MSDSKEKARDANRKAILDCYNPMMIEKKIKLYWLPRSGGSFLRQVLLHLFDVETTAHLYEETELPLVIGYRDFRDCACSQWRIHHGQFDENRNLISVPEPTKLVKSVEKTRKQLGHLNRYRREYMEEKGKLYHLRNNLLWLRYEDFFNNYDYLFEKIEVFFDVTIPKSKREEIIANTSIEANKQKSNDIVINRNLREEFDNVNFISNMHVHHIGDGKVGGWKKLVPKHLWSIFYELDGQLVRWGYAKTPRN